MNRKVSSILAILVGVNLVFCTLASADAGVIIPKNIKDEPDPSILSLARMSVRINADGQYARVSVLQIFRNRVKQDIEGKYLFTLPEGAQVSDFAIWEDGVRIPGVVVERRRAREIYEELTWMKIDPGLLESTGLDTRNVFSVEVYPIPAFGTKRIELEYTTNLHVTSLRSMFSFPLKPTLYGRQSCDSFQLQLDFKSDFPVRNFHQLGKTMPLELKSNEKQRVVGKFAADKFEFSEDFAFEYEIDAATSLLSFSTYRNTDEVRDLGPLSGGASYVDADGYFAASAVFNQRSGEQPEPAPRDVVLMVDTSLSMQWDKLEKSYEALEFFLKNLPESNQFGLVTFNEEVGVFDSELAPADEENVTAALEFFRSGYLMGGTNIAGAVETVIEIFPELTESERAGRERFVILITDGSPTLEELNYARIAQRVHDANEGARAKFMVFGIGAESNNSLLRQVADDSGGLFVWATETEDLEFKLGTFLDKLGEQIIDGLKILFADMSNVDRIYPAGEQRSYDRTMLTFIGRYKQPREDQQVIVNGSAEGEEVTLSASVELPERATEHNMLPRRWAQLRVDYLLMQIELAEEGKDVEPLIEEIIALAKRYKFVTPYTSFLAAPRALLRPRAIRPGDPVLRVRTDEAIVSVVALFPFGLTKPLHYIADEDVWEARFLAPKWMRDGTYFCTLLLSDDEGNLYKEEKDFVIDSRPPSLKVRTDKERYLPGEKIEVTINADRDTRRLLVRLGNLLPAEAKYRTALGASRADVQLPPDLPAGTYTMRVTAVDFARNTTVVEIPVEIGAR